MSIYKIQGRRKLSGEVRLQGAKNSAMKYVLFPLLTDGVFEFSNIPRISSTEKLVEITRLLGVNYEWVSKNTLKFCYSKISKPEILPYDLYFHTSGGEIARSILIGRFGYCEVDMKEVRDDPGGDQIGRKSQNEKELFEKFNIKVIKNNNIYRYERTTDKPLCFDAKRIFGISTGAVLLALYLNGVSEIRNVCEVSEFDDIVNALMKMGAKIEKKNNSMFIEGSNNLKAIKYENICDKHELVTFLSATLCNESSIIIKNVDYKKMKLDPLAIFTMQSGVDMEYKETQLFINVNNLENLKPVNLIALEYPDFITEWQVLLSPVFALINGESIIKEGYYADRLRHWDELGKLGAKYKYDSDPELPENEVGNPRMVRVKGVQKLNGNTVIARDVRCGGALMAVASSCEGETTILDPNDNIKRGYEDLDDKLNSLGAKINSID